MTRDSTTNIDLADSSVRKLNQALHNATDGSFTIVNPEGAHAVACGISTEIDVTVEGSVGYYCAGMHQRGSVTIRGNAGTGLAENMMSGTVRLTGSATMSAGATAQGGVLIVEGNAGARCGISMKGVDIVVGGNIGHMSAFMAQSGNLLVLGDAAEDLGDSIYEADIFVRGEVQSLGTDCIEKELRTEHRETIERLLSIANLDQQASVDDFTRYGSARKLYNFHVDDLNGVSDSSDLRTEQVSK